MSCVMFRMSYVACHLSLNVTNANSHITKPPLADSPTMHSRLVQKDKKIQTIIVRAKTRKHLEVWPILAKIDRQTGQEPRNLYTDCAKLLIQ